MTLSELYNSVSKDILPLVLEINEKGKYVSVLEFTDTCVFISVYTKADNRLIFYFNVRIDTYGELDSFEIGDKRYGDLDYNQIIDRLKTRFN